VARGAREHLLDPVEDQRAIGKTGERVVCRQERQLLLPAGELFVGALALRLEALAHAQQGELEAQLQHVERL
jgi:hypothetical protein